MNIEDYFRYNISRMKVGLYTFRLLTLSEKSEHAKGAIDYHESKRMVYRNEMLECDGQRAKKTFYSFVEREYYRKKHWENKLKKVNEELSQIIDKRDRQYRILWYYDDLRSNEK